MTMMLMPARGSVLLAIVMAGTLPKLFPQPRISLHNWLRSVVVIAPALSLVTLTRGNLAPTPKQSAVRYSESEKPMADSREPVLIAPRS